jgi:FkbM family methyltransferase
MNIISVIIPKLARVLSGKNPFKYLYICICLWSVLLIREILGIHFVLPIPCVYKNIRFIFYCRSKADIAVLREVFLLEEYVWTEVQDPKIIIDLGAHVGDTALFYHAWYSEAKIFAVEPDPASYELLCKNTKAFPEIIPIHAAVTKETGTIVLNTSEQSSLRGSLYNREGSTVKHVVPALSLQDLFKQNGITKADLIKFDIEGGEQDMFGTLSPEVYADAYIGEFHGDLVPMSPESFSSMFKNFNVTMEPMGRNRRFKVYASKIK